LKVYYENILLSQDIELANSFYKKMRGLMFYKNYEDNKGMLFINANWIHSFFMNFAIDVLYLDAKFKVVSFTKNLRPWTFSYPRIKAKHLIEFKAGVLKEAHEYERRNFKCLDFYV